MISLTCINSSSHGNCFAINYNNKNIIIDCGCKNTCKYIDLTKTMGILCSHGHLDHCRDVKDIKNYYNGNFYANKETLDILPIIDSQKQEIKDREKFDIDDWIIMPFSVNHDFPNLGFLLKNKTSNLKMLYIIDTSDISYLYQFKDIDIFIIEANHSYEWLEEKEELDFKDYRTYGSQGHLAVEDTIEFLLKNINVNTKKVILTHISSSCKDYLDIENKVKQILNNENIEVIAIDPHMQKPLEIVLKEDIQGFDFS